MELYFSKEKRFELQTAIDPVCKMEIDEKTSQFKSKVEGKEVYFCCPSCKSIFDKQPSKYKVV
jgi:YHS domain-containing protein